jgi:hypothetical protein
MADAVAEAALVESRGVVTLPPGQFSLDGLTIPWGVSLVGSPGTVLIMTDAIAIDDAGLFRTTHIRDIQFAADGVVDKGINALGVFNNTTGTGEICELVVENCKFIALDADITGYRASEDNHFTIGVYLENVAKGHFAGNHLVGGFDILTPTGALDSRGFVFSGTSVALSWASSNKIQSYCYGIEGTGTTEGFIYHGGEILYCRRGIHVDGSNVAGGAWVNGGHFNVSERGVYFKSRKTFNIGPINVFRNNSYEVRSTWAGVEVDTCQDGTVRGVETEFGTTGFVGASHTVLVNTSPRISVLDTKARFTQFGVSLVASVDAVLDNTTGEQVNTGIAADATSHRASLGSYNFTNVAAANISVNASALQPIKPKRQSARGFGSIVSYSAAGSATLQADVADWVRNRFTAGSGAYVYDYNFTATGAQVNDEITVSLRIDSVNATVNFKDETAATILSINVPSGTKYYTVRARYINPWRIMSAAENLAIN